MQQRTKMTSGLAGRPPSSKTRPVLIVAFNRDIVEAMKARFAEPDTLPEPSPYQADILAWAREGSGHATIRAVAGSGKSTTLEMLVRRGIGLKRRPQIQTLNSLGFEVLRKEGALASKRYVDEAKVQKRADESMTPAFMAMAGPAVVELVHWAKIEGLGRIPEECQHYNPIIDAVYDDWPWNEIIRKYDVAVDDNLDRRELLRAARTLLEINNTDVTTVDYDDMLYLPVLFGLPFPKYRWILVDEAQDLNPIQLEIVHRSLAPDGRLVAVGDDAQAINGFRGAMSDAMDRIARRFDCVDLPLTVTYRCARRIVELAATTGNAIEAAPDAPDGEVLHMNPWSLDTFKPGDLVLCRNTAPLVALATKLTKGGVPTKVLGGAGAGDFFAAFILGFDTDNIAELFRRLVEWRDHEKDRAATHQNHQTIERAQDKINMLGALCALHNPENVRELAELAKGVFSPKASAVTLSTVHKAKGLEADRAFILDRHLMPSKYAVSPEQMAQELNIEHVAYTRARSTLVFIDSKRCADDDPLHGIAVDGGAK